MNQPISFSSAEWVSYFNKNRAIATCRTLPEANQALPPELLALIAASLPSWQLGETSDGRHMRAAARIYADRVEDISLFTAVEMFIKEEQRHGASLGEWMDSVGIPRKSRDLGDTLFRFCRYVTPSYPVNASIVLMVETLAEIYYAAVRDLIPCPRLRAECEQILRDEERHIQFQCEFLESVRGGMPSTTQTLSWWAEGCFFAAIRIAVWLSHGRLLVAAGVDYSMFTKVALYKYEAIRSGARVRETAGVAQSGLKTCRQG